MHRIRHKIVLRTQHRIAHRIHHKTIHRIHQSLIQKTHLRTSTSIIEKTPYYRLEDNMAFFTFECIVHTMLYGRYGQYGNQIYHPKGID